MTSPEAPAPAAPETPVSGAVSFSAAREVIGALRSVLYTEPGWDKPLTMERLHELLGYAEAELNGTQVEVPC